MRTWANHRRAHHVKQFWIWRLNHGSDMPSKLYTFSSQASHIKLSVVIKIHQTNLSNREFTQQTHNSTNELEQLSLIFVYSMLWAMYQCCMVSESDTSFLMYNTCHAVYKEFPFRIHVLSGTYGVSFFKLNDSVKAECFAGFKCRFQLFNALRHS